MATTREGAGVLLEGKRAVIYGGGGSIGGGVPESVPASFSGRDELVAALTGATMLGRTATVADVGDAAAFAASDRGRTMTAATINVSCGALVD